MWLSEAILFTHLLRFLCTELPESPPLLFMCTPSLCALCMLCRSIPALSGSTNSPALSRHTYMQLSNFKILFSLIPKGPENLSPTALL